MGETLFFSADYKKRLQENGEWTDDIPYLNLYDRHHVFVYGTLKRGCNRHITLSSNTRNTYCGLGVTHKNSFDLLIAKPSAIPVAIENVAKARDAKIKGELWLVPTETILRMDRIESNGHLYERVVEKIHVGTEIIPAFMYVGLKDFWNNKELIDNPRMQENGKHYHWFNTALAARLMV